MSWDAKAFGVSPLEVLASTPPALRDPTGVWAFDWLVPLVGGTFIVLAVADVVRRRRLTWGFLFLFNSMAVYWMETVGDWGQQLLYSPAFARHHLLDWLPLKTPNDPVFMPFAYSVYWGVHAVIVLWLSKVLASRTGWSMLRSMLVLAVPVNYLWDFLVEGTATAMGWWTYDPGIGPVLQWPDGGRITLLWTIGVMCVWPNLIAYWAGKPPVRGLNHMERFFGLGRFTRPKAPALLATSASAGMPVGVGRVAPAAGVAAPLGERPPASKQEAYDARLNYDVTIERWRFELMRLGAWFVTFQLSFALLCVAPLVIVRALTGADSPYIP